MSDQEFWRLIESLSEPAGTFSISDNFVSNEPHVAETCQVARPAGGVYIGVGPEQNFSYIARLRPAIAFIIDIRRENLNLHLLYKALFELSRIGPTSCPACSRVPVRPVWDRTRASRRSSSGMRAVPASRELFSRNAALVRERLLRPPGSRCHRPISTGSSARSGPSTRTADRLWRLARGGRAPASYRQLMTTQDFTGQSRSFLASEEEFRFVKAALEEPDRSGRRRFRWARRRPSSGRLRPDACRRRFGFLRFECWRLPHTEQTRAFCKNLVVCRPRQAPGSSSATACAR